MQGLVSFCTTVRDRPQHRQAYEDNLKLARDWHNCEFVLIDYGSTDDTREWAAMLRARVPFRYYRTEAPAYHSPKAKNLAHLSAKGEILVNMDFDSLLTPLYAELVRVKVAPGVIFHHMSRRHRGTYGRIALTARAFRYHRGYDESFMPMTYQDTDLLRRAKALGFDISRSMIAPRCLDHERDAEAFEADITINERLGRDVKRLVNPDGYGKATLVDLDGVKLDVSEGGVR